MTKHRPLALLLLAAPAAALAADPASPVHPVTNPGGIGIRILLIGGTLAIFAALMRRRSLVSERLLTIALCSLVFIAVLKPNITQVVADILGVGRGADLVIYLSFLFFSYLSFVAFNKIAITNRRLTDLTRTLAIRDAHPPAAPRQVTPRLRP